MMNIYIYTDYSDKIAFLFDICFQFSIFFVLLLPKQ